MAYFALGLITTLLISTSAFASNKGTLAVKRQTLPTRAELKTVSPWSWSLSYGFNTDLADSRNSRSYFHSVNAGVEYQLTKNWSLGFDGSLTAETIDGQIEKDPQEDHSETLAPQLTPSVTYRRSLWGAHRFSQRFSVTRFLDKASELEGYQALISASSSLAFRFWNKRYALAQNLSAIKLINSYRYSSEEVANPDYSFIYGWNNSLKLLDQTSLSVNFGIKATRYMDNFWGYSYNNSVSLTQNWRNTSASLSYINGGFVDDGRVQLWYIDEYRRLIALNLGITF